MVEAVQWLARNENLLLDPVYTGKAMAELSGLAREGFFKPHEPARLPAGRIAQCRGPNPAQSLAPRAMARSRCASSSAGSGGVCVSQPCRWRNAISRRAWIHSCRSFRQAM